jgi:mannose-6-phosphate isomerase-like protein (cupin superfamily)
MASIHLAPQETFQHTHDHPSLTRVVQGEIRFHMNGAAVEMTAGTEILVPEHTSHRLENIGRTPAEVYCGHRVENGVPQ